MFIYMQIMEKLIFKIIKSPTKIGEFYYFNIPKEYITNKKINPDSTYELVVYSATPKESLIYKIIRSPTIRQKNYYFSIPIEFIRKKKIDPLQHYIISVYEL